MNNEERAQVITKLEQEKDKVEKHITDLKELTQPISPENAIGRVSRMDAINNKSVNEAALRTAQTKLKNIYTALEKSSDPDFGSCRKCKQDIPVGRLLFMPGSAYCIKCAQRN